MGHIHLSLNADHEAFQVRLARFFLSLSLLGVFSELSMTSVFMWRLVGAAHHRDQGKASCAAVRQSLPPLPTLTPASATAAPWALSPSSTSSLAQPCCLLSRRGLLIAKSPFGYYHRKYGQRKFPLYRRPFVSHQKANFLSAPYFWSEHMSRDPNEFLPKANYITGDFAGLYYLSRSTVYTLQMATSGVPIKTRRQPGLYQFNSPSRWLIGKPLRVWAVQRLGILDEASLSKKTRITLAKKGFVPA